MLERLFKKPIGMKYETYEHYRKILKAQMKELTVAGYWDIEAVKTYESIMRKMVEAWWFLSFEELELLMGKQLEEAREIGSGVYNQLFMACRLRPIEKVGIPIKQLGGYIDANGMLQLGRIKYETDSQRRVIFMRKKKGEYGFCSGMFPGSTFTVQYASQIQKSYGKRGIDNRSIHQFRMYLDLHNITYVRRKYRAKGMTDEEALEQFVQDKLKGKKLLREGARLHNKYPVGCSYTDFRKGLENKKRLTPDYHSEFIIDREGRFVSQWNMFEVDEDGRIQSSLEYYKNKYSGSPKEWRKFQEQIMDTESFNYASASGKDKMHAVLDVAPPKEYDTDIRKSIGCKWKSPSGRKEDVQYYNYASDKGDTYSARM